VAYLIAQRLELRGNEEIEMSNEEIKCPNCGCEIDLNEIGKVEWEDGGSALGDVFTDIAKHIDLMHVVRNGGYGNTVSICDAWSNLSERLCDDIGISDDDRDTAWMKFQKLMYPDQPLTSMYWYGDPDSNTEQEHNARVMACLFFAYMLECEDIYE
jgi:hypothetical protein